MANPEGTRDNPHELDEGRYESAEGELDEVLEGSLRVMWEAGGTPTDILESVYQATLAQLRQF
jgi:hypothetical protein